MGEDGLTGVCVRACVCVCRINKTGSLMSFLGGHLPKYVYEIEEYVHRIEITCDTFGSDYSSKRWLCEQTCIVRKCKASVPGLLYDA